MNNIKKMYHHAGKCVDQKNFKNVLYAVIVSKTEGVAYNSPNVPMKCKIYTLTHINLQRLFYVQ